MKMNRLLPLLLLAIIFRINKPDMDAIPSLSELLKGENHFTTTTPASSKRRRKLNSNAETVIEIPDDETGGDPRLQGLYISSIDPGKLHCAVIQYDAQRDVVCRARLYNLLCTCPARWRGKGPMEQTIDPQSPMHAAKRLRQKDIRVPSSHDFPAQLLLRIEDEGVRGPFGRPHEDGGAQILVAVERQNGVDGGNMVIEACLLSRFYGESVLKDPRQVKQFWNRVAEATDLPPVFRMGSHSVNKTDAKRLGARILSVGELALLRRAAQDNAAHKSVCPSTLKHYKKRKSGVNRSQVKEDDLVDAVLQAICVAYSYAETDSGDLEGPAVQRLKRGALRERLDRESEALYNRNRSRKKRKRNREKTTQQKKTKVKR